MHKISSHPDNICEIQSMVDKWAEQYNLPDDLKCNLMVSLTEAVSNAIIHGNRKDASKYVRIEVSNSPSQFRVVVEDEGTGFDHKLLPDPTTSEKIECCGGRGVFLIRQLCDNMEFKKNGRRVELCFKILADGNSFK
jgi:serine/threonine-protein kinase RsbW